MAARRYARYANKALVERLAEAAKAAGIDPSRCGIEFTREGSVKFMPPAPAAGDLFERYKDQL